MYKRKEPDDFSSSSVLALPIFPARLQASIVGRNELNFRVRNGNGWTLILINTNYSLSLGRKWSEKTLCFSLITVSQRWSSYHISIFLSRTFFKFFWRKLVTRTGIEPMFAAWEAAVLTAWPTGLSTVGSVPSKLNKEFSTLNKAALHNVGQALGLLVSVSWMCYHTYTSDLSTM